MPYYYAGASLDFNPIHIDQDYAKANGWTELATLLQEAGALSGKSL